MTVRVHRQGAYMKKIWICLCLNVPCIYPWLKNIQTSILSQSRASPPYWPVAYLEAGVETEQAYAGTLPSTVFSASSRRTSWDWHLWFRSEVESLCLIAFGALQFFDPFFWHRVNLNVDPTLTGLLSTKAGAREVVVCICSVAVCKVSWVCF